MMVSRWFWGRFWGRLPWCQFCYDAARCLEPRDTRRVAVSIALRCTGGWIGRRAAKSRAVNDRKVTV